MTALAGVAPAHGQVQDVVYGAFEPPKAAMRLDRRIARRLRSTSSTDYHYRNSKHVALAFQDLNWKSWDFAWVHFGTTAPVVAPFLLAKSIPFFIQVHGYDVTLAFANTEYKRAFVRAANQSQGVVCSSHHIKRLCILAGVEDTKLHVICNALDVDAISGIHAQKTPNPSFVHLGRLVGKKHPIATLRAFQLVLKVHPNATLTFIGDGELKEELEMLIESENLSKSVRLTGALPVHEAHKLVATHWVFCQHSVTHLNGDQEGFANSPAEAALMGLPVVSTLHNGIPEHVQDGQTGFLVKEFDFEEMGQRMIELASDENLRIAMGERGKAHIQQICHPTLRTQKVKDLLESTLRA